MSYSHVIRLSLVEIGPCTVLFFTAKRQQDGRQQEIILRRPTLTSQDPPPPLTYTQNVEESFFELRLGKTHD